MLKEYLIEFIGSLLFVYVFLTTHNAFAIGATLALILLFSSTCAINPMITIILSILGRIPSSDVLPYCIVQLFGGLLALKLYKDYKL